MNTQIDIRELIAEIDKTLVMLERNVEFFHAFEQRDLPKLGRQAAAAMVCSQIFTDFYTCLETLFLRIAQTFENNIRSEAWHKNLLHNMTLDIEGIRPAAIAEHTGRVLSEILRFRHFRRYYFDFDYDWDRLALVEKKYLQALPLVKHDLWQFTTFLRQLLQEMNGEHCGEPS